MMENVASVTSTSSGRATPTQKPTPTPSIPLLYPTRTRDLLAESQSAHAFPTITIPALADRESKPCPLADCQSLFGVSGSGQMARLAFQAGLLFRAYYSWSVEEAPIRPAGVDFWQLVNIDRDGPVDSWEKISRAAAALPGSTWIIGNEPDVIWQNNTPPERYAVVYHDLYTYIKEQDPTAQVAVAGVAQPTPLRLQYLDIVLETYQATYGEPLPVDIWTVHGFILQELSGSWGVEIPPGIQATQGRLYTLQDHVNLEIFKQNLLDFREWMADRGYRDRPLALTEFGVLLPADYGFPPELVADFMREALDFLVYAADETGYPPEDGRLVQWWFWFSVSYGVYPTGDLYDPAANQLTYLGQIYAGFARALTGINP